MRNFSSLSADQKNIIICCLIIILFSVFFLAGVKDVPFHPDESTYIFMSDDVTILLNDPQSVFWQPGQIDDLRQHYRKLDPPTSRNMIALSRYLTGQPSLAADWDWSLSWQENAQAGALPNAGLLTASRIGVALLFPFSLFVFYLTVKKVSNSITAWLSMLFLAGNAIFLLHTRRAMSESFLLFAIILSVYFLIQFQDKPWLSSIPIALAINAKLSAAPLVFIGLLAILVLNIRKEHPGKNILRQLTLFAVILLAISFLLNPFLWAHPVQAAQSAWQARLELTGRQVATVLEVSPEQVLDNPAKRIGNLLAHLFYTPPAIADVANYLAETGSSAEAYLSNPLHTLGRSLLSGSLALVLTLTGFLASLLDLSRSRSLPLLFFNLSGLALIAAILILVPLPFQRYVLPALPFACFWSAYLIAKFIDGILKALKRKHTTLRPQHDV